MDLTQEQRTIVRHEAAMASLCIGMVSVLVTMPTGPLPTVYAMPWICLETAKKLADAGARSIWLWPFEAERWEWNAPTPLKRRARHRARRPS